MEGAGVAVPDNGSVEFSDNPLSHLSTVEFRVSYFIQISAIGVLIVLTLWAGVERFLRASAHAQAERVKRWRQRRPLA